MKRYLLALAGLAVFLTGCSSASTGSDLKAVHYSGGAFSAKKYQDCLDPSTRTGFHPGDKYYAYPARQISYDATGGDAAERGRFISVSSDNAELYIPVTVTFNLVSDCDTLRAFHEAIGTRFSAWFDPDGRSSDYGQEWVDLLNFVIGKPLDQTLDRIVQRYPWREVWNDPDVKTILENEVTSNIETLVNRQAGGDFFENFNVLVLKPDPVDENLVAAIADEQAGVAKAHAAEEKAKADEIAAEAQEKLAVAQAKIKAAEISGYGDIEAYLKAQCIQAGCNPFQPTYLVGGSAPVNK